MQLKIETELEADGRWIADIPDLPGVMVYAATREEAVETVKALALRVIADRIEHGESPTPLTEVGFVAA
jgi:predicted RNase H-like HicB family nuclease